MEHQYCVTIKDSKVNRVEVSAKTPLSALNKVLREGKFNKFKVTKVRGFRDCSAIVVLLGSRVHRVSYYKFSR